MNSHSQILVIKIDEDENDKCLKDLQVKLMKYGII